ncbi:MAG: T9SS type A sorting domain-containing protein, partial [Chitinophagales bacterium]|nr:T9SS type A sorting domain-containing protein [Chitinophagales bacterium]
SYNASNKILTDKDLYWNTSNNSYSNSQQLSYAYDINGNETEMAISNWDVSKNKYEAYTKKLKTWQNGRLTQTLNQNYYGPVDGWKSANRELRLYNSIGNLTEKLNENMNFQTNQFVSGAKEEYTYNDSSRMTSRVAYNWNAQSNQFMPTNKDDWMYNTGNKVTKNTKYNLVQLVGMVPYQEFIFEYNATNDTIAYEVKGSFNQNSQLWFSITREEYSCGKKQSPNPNPSSGVNSISMVNISIYPNPVHEVLSIESDEEMVSIEILDLIGSAQVKLSNLSSQESKVDLSSLSPSNYILRITMKSGNAIVKTFVKD